MFVAGFTLKTDSSQQHPLDFLTSNLVILLVLRLFLCPNWWCHLGFVLARWTFGGIRFWVMSLAVGNMLGRAGRMGHLPVLLVWKELFNYVKEVTQWAAWVHRREKRRERDREQTHEQWGSQKGQGEMMRGRTRLHKSETISHVSEHTDTLGVILGKLQHTSVGMFTCLTHRLDIVYSGSGGICG